MPPRRWRDWIEGTADRFTALWSRLRIFVGRFFRRPPPEPGRFVAGRKLAWRGFIGTAPWIAPQREYLVYVPAGHAGVARFRRRPLLVLLHGCRQTPEDIAAGTRIARLADEEGWLVLLPRQNPHANAWGCWNWFDHATTRGAGETAIVAAQIREVRRSYRVHKRRVFVAGMSSGGGLAAIMGVRRPDLVAGVFVHSGVPCGAASTPHAAMNVLKRGADTDVVIIGAQSRRDTAADYLPVPLCAVQGGDDEVVSPVNAAQLVRQYLALNGHPAAAAGMPDTLPPADRMQAATAGQGREITTSEWLQDGRVVARHVAIGGLKHAWSGGDAAHPFHDPDPPEATALLQRFVQEGIAAG